MSSARWKQALFHIPIADKDQRNLIVRRFAKLCRESYQVPNSLRVTGVQWDPAQDKKAGAYSDVYSGMLNGEIVAIKQLRVFHLIKDSQKPPSLEVIFVLCLWRRSRPDI